MHFLPTPWQCSTLRILGKTGHSLASVPSHLTDLAFATKAQRMQPYGAKLPGEDVSSEQWAINFVRTPDMLAAIGFEHIL